MRMRRKPWTEPLLDNCPYVIDRPSTHRGHWREFFPVQRPVYLEIGCGKGVSTVKMAHDNPDVNFIAIDEVRHVLAVSVKNTEAEYGCAPDNLIYSAVDAMMIHDTFCREDGIERIYINFPNPWDERAKHHKRRLTHTRQLIQYRDFLKPGGEIWFKTDNDALFTATKRYLGESGFRITYLTDDLHASGFSPNYVSEHEHLYAGHGKAIHFLIARMAPLPGGRAHTEGGAKPMSRFLEVNRGRLEAFARMSANVGARADYVQGGGGNTSVKLGNGLMAIKASGYRLSDIRPDRAYAVLDHDALRRFYLETEPSDHADVEKAGSARAMECLKAIDGLNVLRPSVEAGFHSLLDAYVIHSHSVYANLAACSEELETIASSALAGADYAWGLVPYVDPGARLTFAIRDELARVKSQTGRRPAVFFLKNHGLIVHSPDADVCLRIHGDVNDRVAAAFGIRNGEFPAVTLCQVDEGLYAADCPSLGAALASGRFSEAFLLESPLYPDQLVFLSGAFAFGEGVPPEGQALCDPGTGRVLLRMPAGKAQVIAETLEAVTFICNTIRSAGYTLSTMGDAAKAFIAGWESEKYRKSLAGK